MTYDEVRRIQGRRYTTHATVQLVVELDGYDLLPEDLVCRGDTCTRSDGSPLPCCVYDAARAMFDDVVTDGFGSTIEWEIDHVCTRDEGEAIRPVLRAKPS